MVREELWSVRKAALALAKIEAIGRHDTLERTIFLSGTTWPSVLTEVNL